MLVVHRHHGQRRLRTMRWGLPPDAFTIPMRARYRGTFFARDLGTGYGRLQDVRGLEHCLIILESFAYPEMSDGRYTRGWFGLHEHPLTAWAGLCNLDADAPGCAGLLVIADERIGKISGHMPRLLMPADHAPWLDGPDGLLSLGPPFAEDAFYHENLGEHWSTGAVPGQE